MRTNQSFLFVVAVLLVSSALAENSQTALTSNPVYQKNCAKCHGKTAEGRHFGGPSLVSADARNMPQDELRNIIANGKHRMPKYAGKLAPAEIDELVTAIKSVDQK